MDQTVAFALLAVGVAIFAALFVAISASVGTSVVHTVLEEEESAN